MRCFRRLCGSFKAEVVLVVSGVMGCAGAPCTEATVLAAGGPSLSHWTALCCMSFPLSLLPVSCLSSTALSIKGIKAQKILKWFWLWFLFLFLQPWLGKSKVSEIVCKSASFTVQLSLPVYQIYKICAGCHLAFVLGHAGFNDFQPSKCQNYFRLTCSASRVFLGKWIEYFSAVINAV